ncbi:MAG: hypothetical protein AB2392_14950 [Neobacillus sp.]
MRDSNDTQFSFLFGFGVSILVYAVSSFLFFWFSIFRRMAVLNIPFKLDSDVFFAIIIIPVMVAIPWIPTAFITGFISLKKGSKTGLQSLYVFSTVITIGLLIVFWNLQYT